MKILKNSQILEKSDQAVLIDQIPEREDNPFQFGSSKPAGSVPAFFLHMAEEVALEPAEEKKPFSIFPGRPSIPKRGRGGVKGFRKLTISQKAEIAALYRTGSVTIADLAEKFKKNPTTIANVIKSMGVSKGEAAHAAAKKLVDAIEERVLTDTEETLRKIAETKRDHFEWQTALAKIAMNRIRNAVKTGTDIASLKDVMVTLKMAGDVVGNSRKELFEILNVERHDQERTTDDLPELMVRELTGGEIAQLQNQSNEEDEIDSEIGVDMLPEDLPEGF